MDRRELLQLGAATFAAASLAKSALAQNAPAAAATANKLKIDAYSRHLLWLKSPAEVADAVIEMAFDGLDLTVRPGAMGHVDPEKVTTDLPVFVNGLRENGVAVHAITCPIADADSPNAERILDAASKLGIHHYWWGTYRYDLTKPVQPQLDALKPRVARLARLNERYGMKAMYHTYSGPGTVGSAVWDLLEILRDNDPRYVSFHWDTGHMTNAGGNNTWALSMRAAGPYVGGLSVKDSLFELDLDVPEGGPFTGTPDQLNAGRGGGGGGAAAAAGGRGNAAAQAAQAEDNPNVPPGGAGGRAQGGAPAGGAAAGGGRGGNAQPAGDPRGGGGQPLPWRIRQVPLGTGQVNLPMLAQVLKEINFNGPVEIQAEYPNGGANNAGSTITLPRAQVLGNMKRDLLTLKAAFGPEGLI